MFARPRNAKPTLYCPLAVHLLCPFLPFHQTPNYLSAPNVKETLADRQAPAPPKKWTSSPTKSQTEDDACAPSACQAISQTFVDHCQLILPTRMWLRLEQQGPEDLENHHDLGTREWPLLGQQGHITLWNLTMDSLTWKTWTEEMVFQPPLSRFIKPMGSNAFQYQHQAHMAQLLADDIELNLPLYSGPSRFIKPVRSATYHLTPVPSPLGVIGNRFTLVL
ncbi:hypothetical protein V8F33_004160 [Rhypophila sp. PSN 637]